MSFQFWRQGAPLIVCVVGGSFVLSYFQQIKVEFKKDQPKPIDREEVRRMGIAVQDVGKVTMETEYAKVKTLDIDSWENKRGPRPWEEGNELYEAAEERGRQLALTKGEERMLLTSKRAALGGEEKV